jgi:hypothetical protein
LTIKFYCECRVVGALARCFRARALENLGRAIFVACPVNIQFQGAPLGGAF